MKKTTKAMVMAAITVFSATMFGASTEAASVRHSMSEIPGYSADYEAPATRHQTQETKMLELERTTASQFVYGSKANYNVVGQLRNPAATVLGIDPFTGQVSQYRIENREDFVEFMRDYCNSAMILISDSQKGIRGIIEGTRVIKNAFMRQGVNGDLLSVSMLTIDDLEDEEIAMAKGFLTGNKFIICQVAVDYTVVEQPGSNTPQKIIVDNGKSKWSQNLEDFRNGAGFLNDTYDLIKRITDNK